MEKLPKLISVAADQGPPDLLACLNDDELADYFGDHDTTGELSMGTSLLPAPCYGIHDCSITCRFRPSKDDAEAHVGDEELQTEDAIALLRDCMSLLR